ncbi:hypothetical protein MRX96_027817 [Rhipicephalus microplus]
MRQKNEPEACRCTPWHSERSPCVERKSRLHRKPKQDEWRSTATTTVAACNREARPSMDERGRLCGQRTAGVADIRYTRCFITRWPFVVGNFNSLRWRRQPRGSRVSCGDCFTPLERDQRWVLYV